MQLFVYPQRAIEDGRFKRDEPYALISITCPGDAECAVPHDDTRVALLRLQFHDVDVDKVGDLTLFTDGHAQQIADLLLELPMATNVVVHCTAGVSRSAAVAAAITRYFGWQEEEFFSPPYFPNRLVYRTLVNVLRETHIARMRRYLGVEPLDARITRLRHRLAFATQTFAQPLPWTVTGMSGNDAFPMVTTDAGRDLVGIAGGRPYLFVSAAELIVDAINELPGLLDDLQALSERAVGDGTDTL